VAPLRKGCADAEAYEQAKHYLVGGRRGRVPCP